MYTIIHSFVGTFLNGNINCAALSNLINYIELKLLLMLAVLNVKFNYHFTCFLRRKKKRYKKFVQHADYGAIMDPIQNISHFLVIQFHTFIHSSQVFLLLPFPIEIYAHILKRNVSIVQCTNNLEPPNHEEKPSTFKYGKVI